MQSEELSMQNLGFIVDHNPEGLALAIPSVVPLEVSNQVDLNFQNRPRNRLATELNVKVRNVGRKFIQLVLLHRIYVSLCFIQLFVVYMVQSYFKLLEAVHDFFFQVAVLCSFFV